MESNAAADSAWLGVVERCALGLVLLFGLSCLTVSPPVAGAGEQQPVNEAPAVRSAPTSWHATAYVRSGEFGLRVIDYWSKGAQMRARTLIAGRPFTTIVSGGRYIVFDGLEGRGIDVQRAPEATREDRGRARPFAFEYADLLRDGGEKIDDVTLGRVAGEVWQVTDARGRRKVWITSAEPQVPVRVETFERSSSTRIDLDYSNWTFELEIPDAFFRAPSDVSLESFEYDAYVRRAIEGPVGRVPILYPDLLHGGPPD